MLIRSASTQDIDRLIEIRNQLWPQNPLTKHADDLEKLLSDSSRNALFYAQSSDGAVLGFAEVSLRTDYVEGCTSSPVVYLEGIFVSEQHRRSGIASELVEEAALWGSVNGAAELASDAEINNQVSIDFHCSSGFREANRVVCFVRSI
jgi:aminoglycoside 6'-N-acetyltransferase I